MNELMTITGLVRDILESDERARNSDSFLYLRVLSRVGHEKGIDINSMAITTFLLKMKDYGFPPFESVRRSRQKLQEKYSHLAANENVEAMRELNEEEYRRYVMGVF